MRAVLSSHVAGVVAVALGFAAPADECTSGELFVPAEHLAARLKAAGAGAKVRALCCVWVQRESPSTSAL